jgi:hypothetical protein
MILSIKISKIIIRLGNLLDTFGKCWEKYLLIICIEIADISIKMGDYYFATI